MTTKPLTQWKLIDVIVYKSTHLSGALALKMIADDTKNNKRNGFSPGFPLTTISIEPDPVSCVPAEGRVCIRPRNDIRNWLSANHQLGKFTPAYAVIDHQECWEFNPSEEYFS